MTSDRIASEAARPNFSGANHHRSMAQQLWQVAQFGAVGLSAAVTHVAIFSALLEFEIMPPVAANTVGFAVAFLVSFFGHFKFTFGAQTKDLDRAGQRAAFAKFIAVALIGYLLNTLAVYLIIDVYNLHYLFSVAVMLTVVPAVVFAISKFWAFAGQPQ